MSSSQLGKVFFVTACALVTHSIRAKWEFTGVAIPAKLTQYLREKNTDMPNLHSLYCILATKDGRPPLYFMYDGTDSKRREAQKADAQREYRIWFYGGIASVIWSAGVIYKYAIKGNSSSSSCAMHRINCLAALVSGLLGIYALRYLAPPESKKVAEAEHWITHRTAQTNEERNVLETISKTMRYPRASDVLPKYSLLANNWYKEQEAQKLHQESQESLLENQRTRYLKGGYHNRLK